MYLSGVSNKKETSNGPLQENYLPSGFPLSEYTNVGDFTLFYEDGMEKYEVLKITHRAIPLLTALVCFRS